MPIPSPNASMLPEPSHLNMWRFLSCVLSLHSATPVINSLLRVGDWSTSRIYTVSTRQPLCVQLCFVTVTLLSPDHHMAFMWLSSDSVKWLSHCCHMAVTWLFYDCQVIVTWQSCDCRAWLSYDCHLIVTWQSCGCRLDYPMAVMWLSPARRAGQRVPIALCCLYGPSIAEVWRCCPLHGGLGLLFQECRHLHRLVYSN